MATQLPIPPGDLQRQWLAKTLLHGRLTRSQVSEAFGVTAPAVTRHARWLLDRALVRGDRVRLPNVKRPVEVFRLDGSRGTSLALTLRADAVVAELLAADARVLWSAHLPVPRPEQIPLMTTLRSALTEAQAQAQSLKRRIDLIGLSVAGYVEHDWGMVFGIRGVAQWEPCMPLEVLGELRDIPVRSWTQTVSKLEGLAVQLQRDDRVGYIDRAPGATPGTGGGLAVASLDHGHIGHGRFGTATSAVHQQVSDDPARCYCGRRGCLDLHLRRGDATDDMLLTALPALLGQLRVLWLGVEWPGRPRQLQDTCSAAGVERVQMISGDQARQLAAIGARHRCTRLLLGSILDKLHPRTPRRIINAAALRKPLPTVSP